MRSRWLKPEFFRDKKMAEAGPITALVYQALWLLADDSGVVQADPDYVHAQLFFRWSAVGVPEVTGALRHLFFLDRIRFFQPGDDLFAEIIRFSDHQTIHKPSAFRNLMNIAELQTVVPEWCGTGEALVGHSPPPIHRDTASPKHRTTKTPRHRNTNGNVSPLDNSSDAGFDEFWATYPKRPNNSKAGALRAWRARRADEVQPETMIDGARRYAAYIEEEYIEPQFIKLASTFLGPDEHYLSDFTLPESVDPYEAARRRLQAEEDARHAD